MRPLPHRGRGDRSGLQDERLEVALDESGGCRMTLALVPPSGRGADGGASAGSRIEGQPSVSTA
ncbi:MULTISPECIES: hypothetical protein [unclassified Streptomyces]|uniref:hypothetical protein n=1 Tax=unclassified Streptomyces TaxID=2593676 RepID=UPI0029B10A2A|nr:hypothetical protein [Streptomyces sp. DK15]MDX2389224.1 hypothetical protein [Streptomyces sp. DK15]